MPSVTTVRASDGFTAGLQSITISMGNGCGCCGPGATCCDDELGGVYPATLTGTITGACCARLNQTFNIVRSGSGTRYIASPGIQICNPASPLQGFQFICSAGQWYVDLAGCSSPAASAFNRLPMTLHSCAPLHLSITIPIGGANCCAGAMHVDITE